MKSYVNKVLDLWQASYTKAPATVNPYEISQQLKYFASLFSPGSFYYYILDFTNLTMKYVHDGTRDVLGLDPKEVDISKLIEILSPEEQLILAKKEAVTVDFVTNFLNPEHIPFYKIVYFFRVQDMEGKYKNMLHQATVLTLTECQQVEHVMVVHTDISHLNFVNNNKISFISLRGDQSYYDVDIDSGRFEPESDDRITELLQDILTAREKEIIHLLAQGLSAEEISKRLFLSAHTIRTHKKNILKKTSCKNTTELVAKCLVEGVI